MPAGRPFFHNGAATPSRNTQKAEGPTAPVHKDKSGMGTGYRVVASNYSSLGKQGAWDSHGGMTFAELSDNAVNSANGGGGPPNDVSAMGNLPMGTALNITYKGKTVTAYKEDTGFGGAGISGVPRVIDLYTGTAQALGFSGIDFVYISRVDGGTMTFPPSQHPNSSKGVAAGATAEGGNSSSGSVPGVTGIPDALAEIGKVLAFLFSLQFLYVVAGGILVILALIFMFSSTKVGGPIVKKGTEAAGAAALL